MISLLEAITLSFPGLKDSFSEQLLTLLSPLGRRDADQLEIHCSNPMFLPKIGLNFNGESGDIQAHFNLGSGEILPFYLTNITETDKPHPKQYQSLKLGVIISRLKLAGIMLTKIDHVGINLPWFGAGIHPHVAALRERLSSSCLYHRYPSGEFWDFILPGDAAEIFCHKEIDYRVARRPKFELVTFDLTSKPLVQIDILTNGSYDTLSALFPEALAEAEFKNIWLYTQNSYTIDLCLVLNETSNQDWSEFFRGCRL